MRELAVDVLADLDVLDQVLRELLLPRPPVRLPVVDDADAHPAGMNFLTHQAVAPFFLRVAVDFFFAPAAVVLRVAMRLRAGARFGFSSATGSGAGATGATSVCAIFTVMCHVRLRM